MFFKVSSLAIACAFALQCTPKVGEDPPKQAEQKIEGTQCLAEALVSLGNFTSGTTTDTEVASVFSCATTALVAFKRYVRGRENDRYSTQEISTFIEQNFLESQINSLKFKNQKISSTLQIEVMKIKRLFIGGSLNELTFSELDQLILLLSQFSAIAVDVNPYMKVFLQKWIPSNENTFLENLDFFEKANLAMQNAAKTLTDLIEKQNPEYFLSDSKKLLEAFQTFYGETWAFTESIDKVLPAVQELKKAIAGGEGNIVKPTEWQSFLLLAGRGYIQYLRYQYFITKIDEDYTQNIVSIFRILEDAFSTFEDLVNLKASGSVKTAEINELFSTVTKIWPGIVTSEKLVSEVMKLKKLVFGGSVEAWTVKDFKNGKSKLKKIRLISDLLFPYYKVYGLSWKNEKMSEIQKQVVFESAKENLKQVAIVASEIFESHYSYDDFDDLMTEIEKLYPTLTVFKHSTLAKTLTKYRPLFIYFKKTVFADTSDVIEVNQWLTTLQFGEKFFSEFLFFKYFIQGESLYSDRLPARIEKWSDSGFETLTFVLKKVPQQKLTKQNLMNLLQELQNIQILENLQKSTANKTLDYLFNAVLLSPKDRLQNIAKPSSFNLKSLEILNGELNNYLETEKFLRSFVLGKNKISSLGLRENIDLKLKSPGVSAVLKTGLMEVQRSLKTSFPMTFDSKGQLIIDKNNSYIFDSKSIFNLNITRMISRLVLRSTAEDLNRIENYIGINQVEATTAWNPVQNLIVDLGIVSSVNSTFINSRFIEANIFLPSSNGDDLVSFVELTDLLSMIFSGLTINSVLEKKLSNDCFNSGTVREKVLFSCVSDSYRQHLPEAMKSTPQFLEFINLVSKIGWEDYLNGALRGAGKKPDEAGMAAMRDVALIPFVIQYIEMVFLKYDLNHNALIQYEDAKAAFPLFEQLLTTLAKEQIESGVLAENEMFALFTYILEYGAPPAGAWDYLTKWKPWLNSTQSQMGISADRTQLAKIIGYIAEEAAAAIQLDAAEIKLLQQTVNK